MDKKEIGLYIHIPFCKQKCYYCDFISFADKMNLVQEYIERLKQEIIEYNLEQYEISTIYIGGGTPSYVESKHIIDILKNVGQLGEENTIEVNPGTVTKEKLQDYLETGINRLSIGLQSTSNTLLKEIGRIHTFEQFLETYNCARNVGFKNINVDLMIGLPNQTIEDIEESLQQVIKLNPEHISVYSLILEEGTKLEELVNSDKIKLPSEDVERRMYWIVKNALEKAGYKHYEISNFAKQGYESKHNMDCWNQNEYIGVGLAAHSYINKTRYSNEQNLSKYLKNNVITIHEKQDKTSQMSEYMLLGLRKIEGVNIQSFKNKFVENPIYIYREMLNNLVKNKLIEIDTNYIKLTKKGIDLANLVWEEFV